MGVHLQTGTGLGEGGAFVRNATGLTRELPATSAFFFNWVAVFPTTTLALVLFYALGAYPGGSLYVGYLLTPLIGGPIIVAIALLSSSIPRSGGDWVLVTRVLGPYAGSVSSVFAIASWYSAGAFIALATVTVAGGPIVTALGLVTNNSNLTSVATNVLSSQPWTFAISLVVLIVAGILAGLGWRASLPFFNVGMWLALGGLLLAGVVVLLVSGDSFVSAFNNFASPLTKSPDTYHQIITAAHKAGVDTNPAFSLSATWPTLGAVLSGTIYGYSTIYVGGEVRRGAVIRTPLIMLGVLVATLAFEALYTALFYRSFGGDFFVAINAIAGTKDYPFAASPYYVFLAAIAAQNSIVAWIMGFTFFIVFPLLLFTFLIQAGRILFALAFDGLLPMRIAAVSERRHVPQLALVVSLVIIGAILAWAVWSTTFFTVLAYLVLFQTTSMFLLCLSAAVLPWRRKEVWRGGSAVWTWGKVPVITVAGFAGMIGIVIVWVLYMSYPGLGITNRGQAVLIWAILGLFGLAFFVVGRALRQRSAPGLDFSEIPPE